MDDLKEQALDWQCCSLQPSLAERPLLSETEADALTMLFKTFSNGIRLRLLHALVRAGELCVTDLAKTAGLKPQAVSNQLQRLVDRGMLASRRQGNNVLYRIVDPCVPVLLERGLCLMQCATDNSEESLTRSNAGRTDYLAGRDESDRAVGSLAAGQ